MFMKNQSKGILLAASVALAIGVLAFGPSLRAEPLHKADHCPRTSDARDTATVGVVSGEATGNAFIGQRESAGPPCEIAAMASCMIHEAPCNEMCVAIGCDGAEPPDPNDNVEPRLQKGEPPTLVLDLGTCGCPAGEGTTVAVACTPDAYAGTAVVDCDGSSTATVTFSTALPDHSCCTLTFSGDIVDVRTILMLEGDVDRDCYVTTADESMMVG